MNPIIDPRTREDIIDEIKALARERTPEWRFDPDNPDAGTMLALIWTDMLCGTIERLNNVCENYKSSLYATLNTEPRQAVSSHGYLVFDVSQNAEIPKGFRVATNGDIVFATDNNLHAATLSVTGIYTASPDTCYRYSGMCNIPLFDYSGDNPVIWTITHPFAFNVSDGGSVGITGASALNDPEQAEWVMSGTQATVHILNKDVFEGMTLCGFGLLPENGNLPPDIVYSNETQQPNEGFYPFGERFALYDELYIACDEVFEKRGATVEFSLCIRMVKLPIEGYPEPSPNYKPVMVYRDLNIPETADMLITEVTWEYFNGSGWAALNTTPHRDIFYSTSRSEPTITFTCPDDFDIVTVGAHEKYYIRARVIQVENAFGMFGHYWSPFIENLRFKYWYETPLLPERVSSFQNMEENLSPVKIVDRVFNEHAMYLSVDNVFSYGTVLAELEAGSPCGSLRWEYYTKRSWQLLNISDCTEGFSKTGLISYSTTEPCTRHTLFGESAYWVRIVDMEPEQRRKPLLKRLWNNAVQAVCETPGECGNVLPDEIVKLLQAMTGVDGVTNPLCMEHGRDEEVYEDAAKRVLREQRVSICR